MASQGGRGNLGRARDATVNMSHYFLSLLLRLTQGIGWAKAPEEAAVKVG